MAAKRLSDRNFGLMFAAVLAGVFGIGWSVFDSRLDGAAAAAAAFLGLALVAPGLLLPLNRLWERVGHGVGRVNNHLLLGAFFFLVVTPAGLALRLLGRDPLHRAVGRGGGSYWTPVTRKAEADTFEDMF